MDSVYGFNTGRQSVYLMIIPFKISDYRSVWSVNTCESVRADVRIPESLWARLAVLMERLLIQAAALSMRRKRRRRKMKSEDPSSDHTIDLRWSIIGAAAPIGSSDPGWEQWFYRSITPEVRRSADRRAAAGPRVRSPAEDGQVGASAEKRVTLSPPGSWRQGSTVTS